MRSIVLIRTCKTRLKVPRSARFSWIDRLPFYPSGCTRVQYLPSDRGRPITELSSQFNLEGFADDIRKVLDDGVAWNAR
jgi:hypothetical protein